ncbi:MAG: hypothetical protein JNL09_07610, partial [Anaerolineales bacterium]|nr:hypothetical protein [Anaerolineales bacterium]
MTWAQGIDISRYQPNVDWVKVRAAGIEYAVPKASQSNFMDPKFKEHYAGARSVGILRSAYHFLVPEMDGPKQAAAYLKALGDDLPELPCVLDIEAKTDNLFKLANIAQQWLDIVEQATGKRPIIYTAAWYWNAGIQNVAKWAGNYPLWVAAYPVKDGFPSVPDLMAGKYKPLLPKSWANWTLWQYSERGRVDGITVDKRPSNVDLNVFPGTIQDLLNWAGASAPPVTRAPEPVAPAPVVTVDVSQATNIQVINAFVRAFGNNGGKMIEVTGLMPQLTARPVDKYTGPAIAKISGLNEAQKAQLSTALGQVLANGKA